MKTIGYKLLDEEMFCYEDGYQFEIGETYTRDNDEPLELYTDNGFHFRLNLEDLFDRENYEYYDNVYEVETESEILTKGNESITKSIKIVREITKDELSEYPFKNDLFKIHFHKLTDDELLKFKDDEDEDVRIEVIKQMKDLNLMYNTFKDDKSENVRTVLVEEMEDLDLIYNTFKDDESWAVRKKVVDKMDNIDLMFKTFKDDKDSSVRHAVVEKMTDLGLPCEILKGDEKWKLDALIKGLTGPVKI